MAIEVMMMERIFQPENRRQLTIDLETLAAETVVEWKGRPVAVILTMEEYAALRGWQEMEFEPMVEEPPRTPEGDLEALAAVERIGMMFADVDPAVWCEIIEDDSIQLENLWMIEAENETD